MWNWLKQFLSPPVFEDEEKTRMANLLNIIVLSLMLIMTAMSMVFFFLFPGFDVRAVFAISYALVLLGIYALMRWGYIQLAGIIFVLSFWGTATTAITISDGSVRSPAFSFYFIITLVAGLLLGVQFGSIVAGLSIIAGIGLVYAEMSGLLIDATANVPLPGVLTVQAFLLVMMVVLLYLYTRQLNQTLERSRRNEQETIVFKAMAENATDSIFMSTPDGEITYANRAGYQLLGRDYEQKEIDDLDFAALIPIVEEVEDVNHDTLLATLQAGSRQGELQQQRRDGTMVDVHSTAFAIQDEQTEEAVALAAIIRDITQQKQVEIERQRLQQEIIEAQRETLKELSVPIIPVTDHVIVMPLIGSIDTMRARDITRALLAGISQHQAKVIIVDITGVPVVDSGVANYLNKTIQAARLKGARVIITGISDAVAEAIVDLGINWSNIETLRDLQTGLVAALRSMGIKLSK
jgi:rsbT co-antagonist protein RsbR